MDPLERFFWRKRVFLLWTFWIGVGLWALLLVGELTSPHPDVDWVLGVLVLGGAGLYFLRMGLQAVERASPRWRRDAAREALFHDPNLWDSGSRRDIIPFLLASDSEWVRLYSWAGRLETLLERLLQSILSSSNPKRRCLEAMQNCLSLLAIGRGHWDGGEEDGRLGLEDEKILEFLLAALALLSALFRFHLLSWRMPHPPFDRKSLVRLRRSWIPFCLLEPTARSFPPPLPDRMSAGLRRESDRGRWVSADALVSWIFRADLAALSTLVDSLSPSSPLPDGNREPSEGSGHEHP